MGYNSRACHFGASEDNLYPNMKNCTNLNIKHQIRNFIGCGFTLFFISSFPKIAILQTIIFLIKQPEIHCRNDFFSLVCSYFIFFLRLTQRHVDLLSCQFGANSRVFLLRQLWIVIYYVKSSSNNLSYKK